MNPLPRHIAIIMDGNGRWAQTRGLPRIAGHAHGVETADTIVVAACELGIQFLTLYAFSDENWERPSDEVEGLMQLLVEFLARKREKLLANGVRLRTIGDTERLPAFVQAALAETMAITAGGSRLTLILALSYGARAEICRAVQRALAAGCTQFTPEIIGAHLDTAAYPDPDLLIRTSGEYRISNYLLWQLSYAELYFPEILWPDFTPADLTTAVREYQQRDRRFGLVKSACS